MTADRKKVQMYLYPSQKPQDEIALNFFEESPTGLRSSAYRHALISGVALAKIDPRLPEIMAVSLSTDPSGKELKDILLGFIGGPEASIKAQSASVKVVPASVEPAPRAEKKPDALSDDEIDNLSGNTFV